MNERGYIYALVNSCMKEMVKVGKTTNDPEIRAKELSAVTGVPTPFIVAYEVYVNDCSSAELYLHTLLEERGYRVSDNREFFKAPLKEVIKLMTQIENSYGIDRSRGSQMLEDRRWYPPSGETDLSKLDIEELRRMDKERRNKNYFQSFDSIDE